MKHTETYDLFMDALEVMNRAMDANRGEGAYGRILDAMDDRLEGHASAVAVYDKDPDEPFDYFTIRFIGGRWELKERGRGEHDTEWKVSTDYLRSLVEDPESYVEHPARLDLDWIADRLPDELVSMAR